MSTWAKDILLGIPLYFTLPLMLHTLFDFCHFLLLHNSQDSSACAVFMCPFKCIFWENHDAHCSQVCSWIFRWALFMWLFKFYTLTSDVLSTNYRAEHSLSLFSKFDIQYLSQSSQVISLSSPFHEMKMSFNFTQLHELPTRWRSKPRIYKMFFHF